MHRPPPALETLVFALGVDGFGVAPCPAMFLHARVHSGLAAWPEITGWQPWRGPAAEWQAAGRRRVDEPAGRWPLVLALPGKSRNETLAAFAAAYDLLEPGGRFIAAIANDCGAARYEKELAAATAGVESISKNKCRAFLARRDGGWDAACLAEWRALATPAVIPGTVFSTVPGVFSEGRIDAGTALLAAHLPPSLHGRVADLGAGWGALSHAVLARCPRVSALDLYEADARALALARTHLATAIDGAAGRLEVGFHWHDVTAGLPSGACYDAVVMNPPFHQGKRTEVSLGGAFLAAAAAALRRGGQLLVVANRQLPYEGELRDMGMHPRVAAQDSTYKILAASR